MSDLSAEADYEDPQSATEQATGREIRRGVWIATAFFGVILGAAALVPLDAGALAQGTVEVSGSRQLVQHREGGTLTALDVTEGQLVKAGDRLAVVSQSGLVADERSLTGEYITLVAQRERLKAQLAGRHTFGDPPEFLNLSPEDRVLANSALSDQHQILKAQRQSLSSQRSVLDQRAGQSGSMIDAAVFQAKANREQRRLIGEELDGLRSLEGRGFVATNRIRELERVAAQLDGEYGALQAEMARSRQSIGETKMQSVSLGSQQFETGAEQLRDVQTQLSQVFPRLIAARERLDKETVRAPATGHVVGLNVHTVGGVVAPGETLMQIVPDNRELVISAKMTPSDADSVKIGMDGQIKFSSLQDSKLPTLTGKISKLSADSMEDQRSGVRYFAIEVVVPAGELDKIRSIRGESAIRAGIPAEVLIPLRKRSALRYLLDPIVNTFWTSGRER
ncbi:MAG: HlyD family type I secretion periplasmic adaptor subunit [Novosphingobium sp.]